MISLFNRSNKVKNEKTTLALCTNRAIRNAASILLSNIQFSGVDKEIKTITMVSSLPNEGKTTASISLADAIGRTGATCVILECDFRRNALRSVFGVRPKHGIHAVLTGKATLDEAVVATPLEGVSFLDGEASIPSPEALLRSNKFAQMLKDLSERFDYVVIDSSPLEAFADAGIIASQTDATIMVVRQGVSQKRALQASAEQLKAVGANVIGCLLGYTETAGGSYGYGYGYGYYYGYEYEDVPADEAAKSK